MNGERTGCPRPAAFAVPWAGDIHLACEYHTRVLVAIGNAIGAPVSPRPLTQQSELCYSPEVPPDEPPTSVDLGNSDGEPDPVSA